VGGKKKGNDTQVGDATGKEKRGRFWIDKNLCGNERIRGNRREYLARAQKEPGDRERTLR